MRTYGNLHLRRKVSSIPEKTALIFTDASSDFEFKLSAIGIQIVTEGSIVSYKSKAPFSANIAVVEAEAVAEALELAIQKSITHVEIHTDCETLVRCLLKPTGKEPSDIRKQLKRISKLVKRFSSVRVTLASRFRVEEVHHLAIETLRRMRDNAIQQESQGSN